MFKVVSSLIIDNKYRISIWHNCLSIYSMNLISICKFKNPLSRRFIMLKWSCINCSIWINPFTLYYFIILPFSLISHCSIIKDICSISMFLTLMPLSWINIFTCISIQSFTVSLSIFPLSFYLIWISYHNIHSYLYKSFFQFHVFNY